MSTCRASTYSHLLRRYGISAPFKVELIVADDQSLLILSSEYIRHTSRYPAVMRHRKLFLECVGYLGYLVILSRLPVNFLGNLQRHLANLGKREERSSANYR